MEPSTSIPERLIPQPPRYNHPCGDLLDEGRRRDYLSICVPLYEASIKGDWEAAKTIIENNPNVLGCSITQNKETALHIATMAQSIDFVELLVERMPREYLEYENEYGNTALSLAAINGNTIMAKILIARNRNLLTIIRDAMTMPLNLAAFHGNRDMVNYLYMEYQRMENFNWRADIVINVFMKCIQVDFFDVALQILYDHEEEIHSATLYVRYVLMALALKPEVFKEIQTPPILRIFKPEVGNKENEATKLLRRVWEKSMTRPKNEIDGILQGPGISSSWYVKRSSSHVLFAAAESGNAKFLAELIRQYPDLIWSRDEEGHSIFHVAVTHRHKSVYNMLHEIGVMKDMITRLIDRYENNMLHLVSRIPEFDELEGSGAAFQMQNELLWFKEVEAMVPPLYRKMMNIDGFTPSQLFTRNHRQLASEGEVWIKGTISQSMVAAALIATIGFSIAFSIPGGYDQNNGLPIFRDNKIFKLYIIFDALSFILSSVSILMFLSILTSSFDDKDFLALPGKLMVGQATLLTSILTVIVAFCFGFFLYNNSLASILGALAVILVFLFTYQQYPLLINAFRTTYSSTSLFKPERRMLYYQNPRF